MQPLDSARSIAQSVQNTVFDKSGNLTDRSARAVIALITKIQPDENDYAKVVDEESGVPLPEPVKRPSICKNGILNFLSKGTLIMASIYGYNLYLKHQTALIALTVKIEMCKLEYKENMCDMEGGPLPALLS